MSLQTNLSKFKFNFDTSLFDLPKGSIDNLTFLDDQDPSLVTFQAELGQYIFDIQQITNQSLRYQLKDLQATINFSN